MDDRRLIEDYLPLDAFNAVSAKEHTFPRSRVCLWWSPTISESPTSTNPECKPTPWHKLFTRKKQRHQRAIDA